MHRRKPRTRHSNRSAHRLLTAAAVASAALAGGAQAATVGWSQTGGGPYDYNTAGNWAESTINDVRHGRTLRG
jgi:hypothetical protein